MTDLSSSTNEESTTDFLKRFLQGTEGWPASNEKIFHACGIRDFFESEDAYRSCMAGDLQDAHALNTARDAFGDFQTNAALATRVVDLLLSKNVDPDFVIEPTCGKGSAQGLWKRALAEMPIVRGCTRVTCAGPPYEERNVSAET